MRSGRHQARLLIECCCNRRRQAWAAFPASDPDFSEAVFLKCQTSSVVCSNTPDATTCIGKGCRTEEGMKLSNLKSVTEHIFVRRRRNIQACCVVIDDTCALWPRGNPCGRLPCLTPPTGKEANPQLTRERLIAIQFVCFPCATQLLL